MTAKEKAESIVNEIRIVLMNEDTDCGNEIICTKIAKQCAFICVDEVLNEYWQHDTKRRDYWQEVKSEIQKL